MLDHSKTNVVDPKLIWEKLICALEKKYIIAYTGNNPYKLNIDDKKVFIYLRNLTRAYTNHSPDVCRIQLHKSSHFEEIKNSQIPFVAIGYYEKYNTIATWHQELVKPRLNGKGNVSLYCRFSEMYSTSDRKIRECRLRNGNVIKITNFNDLDLFLLDTLGNLENKSKIELDDELYQKLQNVINDESELKAIQTVIEFYERHSLYYDMISVKNLIAKFKSQAKDYN
jgi:hypothetical protein